MGKKSKSWKKYVRNMKPATGINFAVEFRFTDHEGRDANSCLCRYNTSTTSTVEAFIKMCEIAVNCIKLDKRFSYIHDRHFHFGVKGKI